MVKARTILGFACVIATAVYAQEVTIGIVGLARTQEPAGFYIAGMPYNMFQTNTPESVYGDMLPSGSKIYKWTGNGYSTATYGPVFIPPPGPGLVTQWNIDLDLGNSQGYWVEIPSDVDAYLSGDVPLGDTVTNNISAGFQLYSYPYPVDRVVTNLGFSPTSGDKIYVWDGSGYTTATYGPVFVPPPGPGLVTKWNIEDLEIKVGQGFWYESGVDTEWVVQRPYSAE